MFAFQFSSLSEFLQMGGVYTFHIWAVYLLFAVFIGYNLLQPKMVRRHFLREQKRRAARDEELASKTNTQK
jgi:heme exporter protein CcmD